MQSVKRCVNAFLHILKILHILSATRICDLQCMLANPICDKYQLILKNIVLLLGQTVKSADIVINHRMSLFYIEEDIYDKQPQWCMS